jgi:homogentisate 1,2-dioxygenase
MLERIARGRLPAKHHTVLRDDSGALCYEECLTRAGFDGPYSILYHQHRPHESRPKPTTHGFVVPSGARDEPLLRRRYRSLEAPHPKQGGTIAPIDARVPLLYNDDVVLSVLRPNHEDPVYFSNGDGDELYFIQKGGGLLRSPFGDLPFNTHDYVYVPKGVPHRFMLAPGVAQFWLVIECRGGVSLPKEYRNDIGQISMMAPFSHRDFRVPEFRGPLDEGLLDLVVLKNKAFHGYELVKTPLDVVGWDGTVYPFTFQIEKFQPRVGQIHIPPTVHATFVGPGVLVCSFVPRPLDFHPDAIPCPYPHSSVDIDEVIFYSAGSFTSHSGVGPGSISHHPAGIPHGPHPGAYEGSIGARMTDEVAVMIESKKPLYRTEAAATIEDREYHESFNE